MKKYYYDFHIHSCLSPCGDDDNTPNNIAGMAMLMGLNIVALTDHNSCKNCPAFFEAANRYGITPLAGMELTTAEDIHVVCLFENLEDAMRFDEFVDSKRVKIKNKVEIFGNQQIMDGQDNIVGEDEFLLTNATNIFLDEVPDLVKQYGGISFPAHIDKQANGIIATLGTFPETADFNIIEINRKENIDKYIEKYSLSDKILLINSDAHLLTTMREHENYLELETESDSDEAIRHSLFDFLRNTK